MNWNRFTKYAEFGMYFAIGIGVTISGLAISTLSVVGIATLAKTPKFLD